jgi:predicted TIM-barrel fold metal-dependent hydrolase
MSGDCGTYVVGKPIPEFTTDFSIDCHSHIQSGATVPLPLLYHQNALADAIKPYRPFIDFIAPIIFGNGGKVQCHTTEEIADILVNDLAEAYRIGSKVQAAKPYSSTLSGQQKAEGTFDNKVHIFTPVIIMPMDMDYSHIAGFTPESSTIYHEGKIDKWISPVPVVPMYPYELLPMPSKLAIDGVYYYNRKKGTAPEEKGDTIDVSHERPNRVWVYQQYYRQHIATIESVKKNPWLLIPMFHYDPRRWCNGSGGYFDDKNWVHGPWDEPFKYIATKRNAGIYIGFKMYPPLGYKPLDPRLPHLNDFYARCEAEEIPILCHCSPGGMTTHEAEFYYELDKADLKKQPTRIVSCTYDPCTPLGYFFDNYVHPKNWRPVLMKYPKLKLCVAHFGGREWDSDEDQKGFPGSGIASDWVEETAKLCNPAIIQGYDKNGTAIHFENVYTDLSCYNLTKSSIKKNVLELFHKMKYNSNYQHLQDRVMFGVDWYLSIVTKAPEYKEFVESFFDTMNEVDQWQWYRSALVNPVTFYGIDKQNIISKMNIALKKENSHQDKRTSGFARIIKIKKQVEIIRRELEKTKQKVDV